MRWEWPYAFLLLLLIPIFHRAWMSRAKPPRILFPLSFPKEVRSGHPFRILSAIRYLAFLFAVAALARPQSTFHQTERQVSGIDIMLTMDVSASMNIEDMDDTDRLTVAKKTIEQFIRKRESDRIGFVIFSGEPLTVTPLTLDYSLVLKGVAEAEPGVLRDGTAIGDGLSIAINRLRNSTAKSRIIILLTDGESNIGQIDPATAGEIAAGFGIKVYTIAFGKEGRVRVPIKRKGVGGSTIVTYQWMENQLNTELLEQISRITDAKFYRVQDPDTLEKVFSEIDTLEKTEIKTTEKTRYEELFHKPLGLAIALLILEKLISRFWWRILP